MDTLAVPDCGGAAPVRENGGVDTMFCTPQTPTDPGVQTTHSPSLLDLDQEDDVTSIDILFATTPQQESRTTQDQSKRCVWEASGGDSSPRDTPPVNNSRRKAKYSSPKSDQVLSVLLFCRILLRDFTDYRTQSGTARPRRVNATGRNRQ